MSRRADAIELPPEAQAALRALDSIFSGARAAPGRHKRGVDPVRHRIIARERERVTGLALRAATI
jgi:hypothetical protein